MCVGVVTSVLRWRARSAAALGMCTAGVTLGSSATSMGGVIAPNLTKELENAGLLIDLQVRVGLGL